MIFLFSPIVGMMIQSDELIFFRGVGLNQQVVKLGVVFSPSTSSTCKKRDELRLGKWQDVHSSPVISLGDAVGTMATEWRSVALCAVCY